MRRPSRRVAAAVLALSVTTGSLVACGGSGQAPESPSSSTTTLNAYEETRIQGAQRLLDALSGALVSGDPAALDALIDPAAGAEFRALMRVQAANLGPDGGGGTRGDRLRLKKLEFRVGPQNGPEWRISPELEAELDRQGSSDYWVTPVETVYALGGADLPGLDEPDVTRSAMFTLARYDDDWKLVGYGDLGDDPHSGGVPRRPDNPVLWDFPGLAASDVPTAGGTSVVLSYPETAGVVRLTESRLPGAVDAVTDFWGEDWSRRAAIVAASSTADFAELTRTRSSDVAVAAAATVFATTDPGKRVVTGQRVILSPSATTLSPEAFSVVLRHELFHVAARLDTAGDAPLWVTEGVAEYVGRDGTYETFTDAAPELAAAVAAGDVPGGLPGNDEFSVASDAARLAYQSAWSFAAYVAGEYGREKLRDLYVAAAKGGSADTVRSAAADALGTSFDELISAWQDWLRDQVGA